MNTPDIARLAAEYAQMSDEQLKELLKAKPDDFLPQAYQVLYREAQKRGISAASDGMDEQKPSESAPSIKNTCQEEPAFVQLAVINSSSDLAFLESLLAGTDIAHSFENLRLRYRSISPLPVALFVEESRVDDAIELLKDFQPHGTIVLW
jgi:hypothetical protein